MFLIPLALADPLADYKVAVASATAAIQSTAMPKIATCKRPTAPVVVTVDLDTHTAITATIGATGPSKSPLPCIETAVLAALKPRPAAGKQAVVVLDTAGRLDGDVALLGELPNDAIEAGVLPGMRPVAACYAAGLDVTPGLGGELVVSFTVLPDGRVLSPTVKRDTLLSADTAKCVLAQVSGMRFQPPSNNAVARVSYPFTFNPPEE